MTSDPSDLVRELCLAEWAATWSSATRVAAQAVSDLAASGVDAILLGPLARHLATGVLSDPGPVPRVALLLPAERGGPAVRALEAHAWEPAETVVTARASTSERGTPMRSWRTWSRSSKRGERSSTSTPTGGRLPLWEELAVVFAHAPDAVVLVDDFAVRGDPGYGYDDYGPGQVLDAAHLGADVPDGFDCWYPALPSAVETGARRGCVVIARREHAPLLERCLLRR